ncbi:MAG: IclR family transcriptional regulator [Candidatus Competibacteraceae bacterium]|nr:IclR family transcriptional regulator [Candidatus Competibacteraceae bacterium]
MDRTKSSEGTQSIDRATAILDIVAAHNEEGLTLSEVLEKSQLARATARRLLMALVKHGFVARNAANRRYFLGQKIYELGLVVLPVFDFSEIYLPSLTTLVERTGDTVFLNRLVGNDVLCIARETGDFPVKAFVLDVGVQRPIGVGAGGIALLAAMESTRASEILQQNADRIAAFNSDIDTIEALLTAARESGHVIRDIPALGIRTVAMAIRDSAGTPFAAISISTIIERMQGEHLQTVLATLRQEVDRITEKLSRKRPVYIP